MKRRRHSHASTTYSLIDELTASPTDPLPKEKRDYQLTSMYAGLAAIERGEQPTKNDWRVCSDAVNIMETLVELGVLQDTSGLLMDAVTALAMAGRRNLAGGPIRLDGKGILAMRAVLEDYAQALEALPARVVIHAHRRTERRMREILAGRRRPHDVELVGL